MPQHTLNRATAREMLLDFAHAHALQSEGPSLLVGLILLCKDPQGGAVAYAGIGHPLPYRIPHAPHQAAFSPLPDRAYNAFLARLTYGRGPESLVPECYAVAIDTAACPAHERIARARRAHTIAARRPVLHIPSPNPAGGWAGAQFAYTAICGHIHQAASHYLQAKRMGIQEPEWIAPH